jgi:phospholipid/cholesterol/gamma-HCH transport system substrate-binding protein
LTATAEALTGVGERFGESLVNGNRIRGDLNSQMPQIRYVIRRAADLADVYADASPDLWHGLDYGAARSANSPSTRDVDINFR